VNIWKGEIILKSPLPWGKCKGAWFLKGILSLLCYNYFAIRFAIIR
jgi:hypothetical protein